MRFCQVANRTNRTVKKEGETLTPDGKPDKADSKKRGENLRKIDESNDQLAERKRRELHRALESGCVADPISGVLITSILVSAAVSASGSSLSRRLPPRRGGLSCT
jgi:hypothetical protein